MITGELLGDIYIKESNAILALVWAPFSTSQHPAHSAEVCVIGHTQCHATAFLVPCQDDERHLKCHPQTIVVTGTLTQDNCEMLLRGVKRSFAQLMH